MDKTNSVYRLIVCHIPAARTWLPLVTYLPSGPSTARGSRAHVNRWLLVATLASVLLIGSVIPLPGFVPGSATGGEGGFEPAFDLVAHFLGYLALALSITLAIRARPPGQAALIALVAATLFGALIELVQAPIPYRQFSLSDLIANAVGAGVGAVVGYWISQRHQDDQTQT